MFEQALKKRLVRYHSSRVAPWAHHQRLSGCVLEAVMPLFHITCFVRMSGLSLLTMDPVMAQQPFVCSRELSSVNQVVHRGAQPVRPVLERNSPQLPKCILQSLAQALERFRITNGPGFPVRVGQNE